jgi:dihydroorotate dehydrogenase electron transfer subunit
MEVNVKKLKYSPKGEYFILSVEYNGEKVEPGQFFRLKTPTGPYIARPYSVYDFEDGILTFLVKSGGEFEQHLKTSCKVEIDGPFGNALPVLDKPLLVSGGVGYAPLHFYAKRYPSLSIIGAKDDDLFELVEIPSSSIYAVEPTTVLDVAKYSPVEDVIACGPLKMLEKTKETFANRNLFLVLEEKMACGRGMCESCAVMTSNGVKFVCKDGPAFSAKEVNLSWRA